MSKGFYLHAGLYICLKLKGICLPNELEAHISTDL